MGYVVQVCSSTFPLKQPDCQWRMNQLTLNQLQIYTRMFKEVDLNHDGRLNKSEVKGLCVELGFDYDDSQVKVRRDNLPYDK